MNYEEALSFFHSFDRFGVQPGLSRVCALLSFLGNPHRELSFVHVAGTNGKGSTVTMLSQVFRAAGHRVGLYTSPYVLCFRERIQINNEMISEDELARLAEQMQLGVAKCHENNIYPTEFEVVTAAAFLYFRQKNCDLVVLEVGLGGRFDATNVIGRPEVCVITSVSLDHVGILGDTAEKIAYEKAGIIKENVPVVTSKNQPQGVAEVIARQAVGKNSPLYFADATLPLLQKKLTGTQVQWKGDALYVPFAGAHMIENACLVIQAATLCAEKWGICDEHIRTGIAAARIPARLEVLSQTPPVILDGAHNAGSTAALAQVLQDGLADKKILAVMGMMADKEVDEALHNLLPCFSYVLTATPSNPRAMSAQQLSEKINRAGTPSAACSEMRFLVQKAMQLLPQYDALVICGSLYLAADVRREFLNLISS